VKKLEIKYISDKLAHIGAKLRSLRLAKGISIKHAAIDLGICYSYLRFIEVGHQLPSLQALSGMCAYYDITLSKFFEMCENGSKRFVNSGDFEEQTMC
jgi:transcriptional regulator with XRE-family HTH domain